VEFGWVCFWVCIDVFFVLDELVSVLVWLCGLFDIVNGMIVCVDFCEVVFFNVDLMVYFFCVL